MADWMPQPELLRNVVKVLMASDMRTNRDDHHEALAMIRNFNQNPEFNKYLVYVVSRLTNADVDVTVRQLGGIILKNNLKGTDNPVFPNGFVDMPRDVQTYVAAELFRAMSDQSPFIRQTIGSVVTSVYSNPGFHNDMWPDLLPRLIQLLESQNQYEVDGAFDALFKLSEDAPDRVFNDPNRPLNKLIPMWIRYFEHPNDHFRHCAVACINQFIVHKPPVLVSNMNVYLQGISSLAQDKSPQVRKSVCLAIVTLLESGPSFIAEHIESISEFMLKATQDSDDEVALEACEFWSAFCETEPYLHVVLKKFFPQLIPVLLNRMVYSAMDIEMFEAEEAEQNESVPDRPEDIRPMFHRPRGDHGAGQSGAGAGEGYDEGSDEDDDDDDDDGEVSEWNIRKCAAASLDMIAGTFGDAILPILLPLLQERLSHPGHWSIRESGILALGAIAEGCLSGVEPHLPQLFPYLIHLMNDPAPLIRSITCWTLSRYSRWTVSRGHEQVLKPLVESLLVRILDNNKKVQEAACSAFATLEEEANMEILPYIVPILQTFMKAFEKYQQKNLIILYDAVGTLADAVSYELDKPEYISLLMPPLIHKWNSLSDTDSGLFALLECLTSVAQALGPGFQDFAQPVWTRCLRIIENTLIIQTSSDHLSVRRPTNAVHPAVETLVASTNIIPLLYQCMENEYIEVRQSSFGLIGDLARICIHHLHPGIPQIVRTLNKNLQPEYPDVCSNASWALGELIMQVGPELKPFANESMKYLIPIMNRRQVRPSLLENIAITIGRLSAVHADVVGPLLPEFLKPWCMVLQKVRDPNDRDSAFRGLCAVIQANPAAALQDFIFIVGAITSWRETPQEDLLGMMRAILHEYKRALGDQWPAHFDTYPPELKQYLQEIYQL